MADKIAELNEKLDALQVSLDAKQAALLASQEKTATAVAGLKQIIVDLKAQSDEKLQPLIDKAGAIITDVESTPEDPEITDTTEANG